MKQQLSDYGINLNIVLIKCDNTNTISFTKNSVLHSRKKHIEIMYHFIIYHVEKGDYVIKFVSLSNQLKIFLLNHVLRNFFFIRTKLRN